MTLAENVRPVTPVLVKVATAAAEFGTTAGFQLRPVFQLEVAPCHVCAAAGNAVVNGSSEQPSASRRLSRSVRRRAPPLDRGGVKRLAPNPLPLPRAASLKTQVTRVRRDIADCISTEPYHNSGSRKHT